MLNFDSDTYLNFQKYLQEQLQFQKQKKLGARKVLEKDTQNDCPRQAKQSKKKRKKGPLDMQVMFPKKRRKKEELGLRYSDHPRYVGVELIYNNWLGI